MPISIWYRIPNRAGTHKLDVNCPDNDSDNAIAIAQKAWRTLRQGGFLMISPMP